jgi:hypothetical protein
MFNDKQRQLEREEVFTDCGENRVVCRKKKFGLRGVSCVPYRVLRRH